MIHKSKPWLDITRLKEIVRMAQKNALSLYMIRYTKSLVIASHQESASI
jgi:hypothetical protein